MAPVYLDESDPPSKRAVLGAALRLFAKKGLNGTTIRDIATEAGFSNPVLFKYFASRDALAAFLFARCYRAFSMRLASELRAPRPFAEKVSVLVDVFLSSMDEDLDAHVFVQDNLRALWPTLASELRRHSLPGLVRRLLEEGAAEGGLDPTLDPALLSVALLGTLTQLARAMYFREVPVQRAVDLQDSVERIFDRLLRT